MHTDWLTLGLGFLEGLALIASPCILPILPVVLAGSIEGSKKRPVGIIVGFVFIFALFTFFSRQLVQLVGINTYSIRVASYVLLVLLATIMMSSYLTRQFNWLTRHLANAGTSFRRANDTEGGFLGGILFGGLVALIWTPCAGPILAAVIVQTVLQETTWMSFLNVLAFALGAAVPMFLIAILGRKIMDDLGIVKQQAERLRQLLGFIILLSVGYMIYMDVALASLYPAKPSKVETRSLQKGLLMTYEAPHIEGITAWINSPPLTISDLKGKVVLIDFWTYSCINCIRTLPYLKSWYAKYHKDGLVIIGVHSPEFDFEQDDGNVKAAVTKFEIPYPVALDNQFVTWRNFNNQYWPAQYLINQEGKVVYSHFGEGDDDIIENNIRYLLGMNAAAIADNKVPVSSSQTPETYLGYARAERFQNEAERTNDATHRYTAVASLPLHAWTLQGEWTVHADHLVADVNNASLSLHFKAKKVFLVMGANQSKPIKVNITLKSGATRTIEVDAHQLYDVVILPAPSEGEVTITAEEKGLKLYAFTFET